MDLASHLAHEYHPEKHADLGNLKQELCPPRPQTRQFIHASPEWFTSLHFMHRDAPPFGMGRFSRCLPVSGPSSVFPLRISCGIQISFSPLSHILL